MSKGQKHDTGKLRTDLVEPIWIESLAEVLGHGAKKYGDNNWKGGIAYSRVYGAILRHLLAWRKGKIKDAESNLPHLWHAFTELAFLIYYESRQDSYMKFQDLFGVNDEVEITNVGVKESEHEIQQQKEQK